MKSPFGIKSILLIACYTYYWIRIFIVIINALLEKKKAKGIVDCCIYFNNDYNYKYRCIIGYPNVCFAYKSIPSIKNNVMNLKHNMMINCMIELMNVFLLSICENYLFFYRYKQQNISFNDFLIWWIIFNLLFI